MCLSTNEKSTTALHNKSGELIVQEYNSQAEEWVSLIHTIYEKSIVGGVPALDFLYSHFQAEWLKQTVEFLLANADTWEITTEEINSIEDNLQQFGFVCPSHEQIQEVLHVGNLCYRAYDGKYVKMSVKAIW